MNATMIGLDIGKRFFQVHGVDETGAVVVQRSVTRGGLLKLFRRLPRCVVGIEACATAHHWGRALTALGHEVRLIPPSYVKPYVRRNKSDAADAAAICEAVGRPSMRFVPVKTAEQQAARSLTRVRDHLIRQRTAAVNALRGHLAEFGVSEAKGAYGVVRLRRLLADEEESRLPVLARESLQLLARSIEDLETHIAEIDRRITEWHKTDAVAQRLKTVPGVGTITASVFSSAVPDPAFFRSGREFAAWLGLVPRQNSTGGRTRLGGISKRGDPRLRGLLIVCASSVLQGLNRRKDGLAKAPWLARLLETKPRMKVVVALANKLARTIWALMTKATSYRPDQGFLPA